MFEQQLYNQPTAAPNTYEGDLFHNYEIRNWNFTPRLYKILAVSAIANLLVIFIIGQTNLLTMRGCDSPFVGRVCQVLDTVYVGAMIFGTDREYVDAEYDRIDLADADITYIDVSSATPPLTYPEGYFQIANPVQYAQLQQQDLNFNSSEFIAPGIPRNPAAGITTEMLNMPPVTPESNPNAVKGGIPDSPFSIGGNNPTISRNRGKRPRSRRPADSVNTNTNTKPDEDTVADKTDETKEIPTASASDPVTAVEINRKPMTDFADSVLVKWTANELDLNQPFTVVLDGVVTKDGKLDKLKSKWDTTKEKGDAAMIEVAKQSVEAISQSGWLAYLRNLGVEKINFTLVQDDQQITAIITSDQKTPNLARQVSSGLNGHISIAKVVMKNPSDERTLLDGATVTSEGRNFILNFKIPKPVAQEMINRNLKEAQAKKQLQAQPNGTAAVKPNDNTAKK